ncbi:hypothetical protein BDZ45DRAFT_771289 [Acephala macrosclerotiorum]|nr:hypothetical protein BDZ45DRAFT_771289 [Acephala macrosclerotiorum]
MAHIKAEGILTSEFEQHAILIFLLCCSAGVITGVEVVIRRSKNDGSVLSFELHPAGSYGQLDEACPYAESSVSNSLYFCYKYLPTLLAVILASMWEAVVLDIQRIEPFYQLSQPDGALVVDSLLLNYTQTFLPKVSLVALKKKHYLVFVSFLCLLLVGLLAPIFQSGFFSVNISPESAGV